MFQRKFAVFLYTLLLAAGLLLTACGDDTPTATVGSAAQGGLSGEISFQVFGDPAELAVFKAIADGYKRFNPNGTVNIIHVPAQGDHMTKLATSFAGGTPPDVFLINYRRFGQYAAQGVIEPAGPLLASSKTLKEADYYPQTLDAFRFKGELMCVPQNISSLVVYYNKDMFEAAGVKLPTAGWTWDDFLAAASKLTKDTSGDGIPDIWGISTEAVIIRLAPFVWQNGGDIVDDPENPTTLTLGTGAARDAVQFFMDLRQGFSVAPPEVDLRVESEESRFITGKLGMLLNSRAVTPTFRQIKGFIWDVGPLPQRKQQATILHSDAYCIAAPSKNKDLAWSFVEYAQGTEGQTIAAKLGRTVPSLKSIAESPAFLDPTQSPASSQVFLDAIQYMRRPPILSTWSQIENTVDAELERAFYGYISVDEAIRVATEKTQPLFAAGQK